MNRFLLFVSILFCCFFLAFSVSAEQPLYQDLWDEDAEYDNIDDADSVYSFNDEYDVEMPFTDEADEEWDFSDEADEEWFSWDEEDDTGLDSEYYGRSNRKEEDSFRYWAEEPVDGEEVVLFEPITPLPELTPAPNADPGSSIFSRELSDEETVNSRVTLGADLTPAQRRAIYEDFGIEQGSVSELIVTNTEERAYLSGLISEKKIGRVSLSCAYIQKLPAGSGLNINLHNINYITGDIYRNALITAGIKDAYVVISAPYPVSGTGALVGIYKAYEDITGNTISEQIKQLSAEELIVTGELSEAIGGMEAAELIAQLKLMLRETENMSDEAVRARIDSLANAYGIKLSKKQCNRILKLVRRLESMEEDEMQEELESLVETAQKAKGVAGFFNNAIGDVKGFFGSVGGFLDDLFD